MGHLLLAGVPGGGRPVECETYFLKQQVTVRMMGSRESHQKLKKAGRVLVRDDRRFTVKIST